MKSELTLNSVKRTAQNKEARISDFLTKEQKAEIAHARATKHSRKKFDQVDAYVAEIIARFGYDAYKDWKAGIISEKRMSRMVLAERAREKEHLLAVEGIIIAMTSPLIQRQKGKPAPKSPKMAIKIYKEEAKIARGE